MYLAAIKRSNTVVELNIQQMGEGALVAGQRLQVSGPDSRFLKKKKKKKSGGQSLSEVILRIERVLHENQSANWGQLAAGRGAAAQAHSACSHTHTPGAEPRPPSSALGGAWSSEEPAGGWRGRGAGHGTTLAPRAAPLGPEVKGAGEDAGPGRPGPAPRAPPPRAAAAGAGSPGRPSIHWVVCRESSPAPVQPP